MGENGGVKESETKKQAINKKSSKKDMLWQKVPAKMFFCCVTSEHPYFCEAYFASPVNYAGLETVDNKQNSQTILK